MYILITGLQMNVFVGSGMESCSGMNKDGWSLGRPWILHLAEHARGWNEAVEKRDEGGLTSAGVCFFI